MLEFLIAGLACGFTGFLAGYYVRGWHDAALPDDPPIG